VQPVWAVAFAAVFLNEMPLGREMIGGTLLLAAILLSITPHGVKDTAENGSR
jgi:drug/metabolite transporter (DMT)-like permease